MIVACVFACKSNESNTHLTFFPKLEQFTLSKPCKLPSVVPTDTIKLQTQQQKKYPKQNKKQHSAI
jgi:hypothetical protein